MSNVASRTYKKKAWLRDAPGGAFGRHAWQSHDFSSERLPKMRPPNRGNSMAWRAQGHRFLICVGVIVSVKSYRPELIKREGFAALAFNLHLEVASRQAWQSHDFSPKRLLKTLPPKRGNSMAWRAQGHRFLICVSVIVTLRPEPIRREGFAALAFNLHLEVASRCTWRCVWESGRAKPRLLTQKASENAPSETGKQQGLARPFWGLRCSLRNGETALAMATSGRPFWGRRCNCSFGHQFFRYELQFAFRACLSYDENRLWARSPW